MKTKHVENYEAKVGEEMAVLLWSFAAAKKIDFSPEIVFHEHGYKGENKWLLVQFNSNNFIGLALLQWMGFVDESGRYVFPNMKTWLRK